MKRGCGHGTLVGARTAGNWVKRSLQSAVLVAVAVTTPEAWSAGGIQVNNVAAGSATFSQQGSVTTFRTGTQNTIINYQRLSVYTGETLKFVQPGSNSRVLNRIQGAEPTQIDGTLWSNGRVYLVNPAGVTFGNGAVVDVGQLYAAAGHISDANFLAGKNAFTSNTGAVQNYGVLRGDQIHLVGGSVANFGQIVVSGGGVVTMTAGNDVYLAEVTSPTGQTGVMVKVSSDGGAHQGTGVTNGGTLTAPEGQISLGAGDIYAAGIFNSGTISGRTITTNSGQSTNVNTGTVDASSATGKGGTIEMLGDKVGVFAGTLDASGATGGGTILVGGDVHGGGDVPVSEMAVLATGAALHADATVSGDGGKIVVFASGATEVGGVISTLDGAGGVGGFVETSGLGALVITQPPQIGRGGTWLLDPHDITISNGNTTGISGNATVNGNFTAIADSAVVKAADILTALGSGNVIISTGSSGSQGGTITWNSGADITYNFNATQTLTLNANSTITINGNITNAGANDHLNIALNSANGDVDITGTIKTNGGTFSSTGSAFTLSGTLTTNGAAAILNHTGVVAINGNLSLSAGDFRILSSGSVTEDGNAVIATTGNFTVQSSGTVNLAATNNSVGAFAVVDTGSGNAVTYVDSGSPSIGSAGSMGSSSTNNGVLTIQAAGDLSVTGNISTSGGALVLSAGDESIGGTQGNLTLQSGTALSSGGGNITLKGTDVNATSNNSISALTGTLLFEGNDNVNSISVGVGSGTLSIGTATLASIVSAATVQIGNLTQSGNVSVKEANLGLSGVVILTSGKVTLDDNGNTTALAAGGNVSITAGADGIAVAGLTTGNHPEITTVSGTSITLTSGSDIGDATHHLQIGTFTGNVAASGDGNIYIDGLGASGLAFLSLTNTGNITQVDAAGNITVNGTISGDTITLTAAGNINGPSGAVSGTTLILNATGGGIGTTGALTIDASGNATLDTTGAGNLGNITITLSTPTVAETLTFSTDAGTAQTITVQKTGDLVIGGNITAQSGDALVLRAGTGGTGNLSFSASATISADALTLRAGSSSNSTVDLTNATLLGATGSTLTSLTIEQGASIASITAVATATSYTVISDAGSLGLSNAAAVAGTNLTLTGNTGVFITTDLTGGNSVLSLTVNGATSLTGNVNATAGGVAVNGALTLGGNTTITATGNVAFGSTVDSVAAGDFSLTVSSPGVTSFAGNVGSLAGNSVLGGLAVTNASGTITLGSGSGNFTAKVGSPIDFAANVVLMANTTLTAANPGGNVTFEKNVDSQANKFFTLTIDAQDVTWFEGDVGSAANGQLGALDILASGGTVQFGNGGAIAFNTKEDAGVNSAADGHISIGEALSLKANTTISVTTTAALGSLGAGVGDVTFGSTVDSPGTAFTLAVNAPGVTTFKGDVGGGGAPLAGLSTNFAGGALEMTVLGNGGAFAVTTSGDVTLSDNVVLAANTTINAGAGNITFGRSVASSTSGSFGLTVTTSGTTSFAGGVSTIDPLSTLLSNGGGLTTFGGSGNITVLTTGTQQYDNGVVLAGNTTFNGSGLTFNSVITGSTFNLTLIAGAIALNGNDTVQGTGNLTIQPSTTGSDIVLGATTGGVTTPLYLSRDTLRALKDGFTSITIGYALGTGNITIASDDTSITPETVIFRDPVTIQAGGAGSTMTLRSPAAGTPAILGTGSGDASITLIAKSISLNGDITIGSTAGGNITLNATGGNIILDSNSTLTGNAISLTGALNSSGSTAVNLTLVNGGNVTLGGPTGTLNALGTVSVTGGSSTTSITGPMDVGELTIADAASISGAVTSAGNISVAGNLSLSSGTLTATAGSIGLSNANATGNLSAGTSLIASGNLTLTGNATAGSNISITGITTAVGDLTATAGSIAFTGNATVTGNMKAGTTITASANLTLTGNATAGGNISITGIAGVSGELNSGNTISFTTDATAGSLNAVGAITAGGNLTLTGNATAGGDITVTGLATLTGGGLIDSTGGNIAFNGGADITGNLLANINLIVSGGNLTLDGNATATTGSLGLTNANATGNLSAGTSLIASGNLTLTGNATAGSNISITGITITVGDLTATAGSIAFTGNATVTGNMTAGTTITASGKLTLTGSATAGGNISITGIAGVSGELNSGNTISFTTDATAGSLNAVGAIAAFGNLTLTGNATAGGNITVVGLATLTGGGTIDSTGGSIALNGGGNITGNLLANKNIVVSGGNLTQTGNATATTGTISLTAASVTGNLFAGASIVASGNLTVTGNVTASAGSLSLTNAVVTGNLTAGSILSASGNLTLTGSATAGGNITVAGLATLTGNGTIRTTGGDIVFSGGSNIGSGNTTGNLLASGNIALSGGNLTLSGNIVAGSTISGVGNVTLASPLTLVDDSTITANGATGMTLGTVDGAHALTLTSNNGNGTMSVGVIGGSTAVNNLTFKNANLLVLGGNVTSGGNVRFEDSLAGTQPTPDAATIVHSGSDLKISASGSIFMEENQKLTLKPTGSGTTLSGTNLTIISTGSQPITLGDLNALGSIIVTTGPLVHITIQMRPDASLRKPDGSTVTDRGTDIIAGNTLVFTGTITVAQNDAPSGAFVQFQSINPVTDLPDIKFDPLIVSKVRRFPALTAVVAADFTVASGPLAGTILDLQAQGLGSNPQAVQGTGIPRDLQTLQPERGQSISGAMADFLQQMGIYAYEVPTEDIIDFLIGRALYNDVPLKLNPSVIEANQVAANRLPYSPVLPTIEAYRRLFLKPEVDDNGNPVLDENGKPKMTSQDETIKQAIGVTYRQYRSDEGDQATPKGFRSYLEKHAHDSDANYARVPEALSDLNQLRDLLAMIKRLGLTPAEYDVSQKVILGRACPPNIRPEDFVDAVMGSTVPAGAVAVEAPTTAK